MRGSHFLLALMLCAPAVPALAQSAPAAGAPSPSAPSPSSPAVTPAAPHAHRAHHPRMSLAERFKHANITGDGHLTQEQAKAGHLFAVARHFDAIDTQHHGYVTLADIQSYEKTMRAKRHAAWEAKHRSAQG